jgi:hypothetical protein
MPFLALGALIGRRIDMIKCGSTAVSVAVGGLLFSALFVLVFLRINEIPIISLLCGIIGSLAALIIVKSFGVFATPCRNTIGRLETESCSANQQQRSLESRARETPRLPLP